MNFKYTTCILLVGIPLAAFSAQPEYLPRASAAMHTAAAVRAKLATEEHARPNGYWSHDDAKAALLKVFTAIELDDDSIAVCATQDRPGKGVSDADVQGIRQQAMDFFEDNLMPPTSPTEQFYISTVKTDRSASQVRLPDGTIDPNPHLKTHFVIVTIARRVRGLPVVNSYLKLGIDPDTRGVTYAMAHNWTSLDAPRRGATEGFSSARAQAAIEKRVATSLLTLDSPPSKNPVVNEVAYGWVATPDGSLAPALVHHFTVETDAKAGSSEPETYNPAFIERLD